MDVLFDHIEVSLQRLIWQENSYYPFGLGTRPIDVAGDPGHRFTYNGKELEEATGWLEYGARRYDAQIARWGGVDALAEKYYHQTPIGYAGNNPIIFVDYDGNDYGVHIDHKSRTITIRATYYADANSIADATASTNAWNTLSGTYTYTIGKGRDAVDYTVNFQLQAIESTDPISSANSDNSGEANIYQVTNDPSLLGEENGQVNNGRTTAGLLVYVNSNREGTQTGEHEIGHSLGMIHNSDNNSLMKVGGNHDGAAPNPQPKDIKAMVKHPAKGKRNGAAGTGTVREINSSSLIGEVYPDTFKHSQGFRVVDHRPLNKRGKRIKLWKGRVE
jgi:RHS repeat-associated protein